jgi:hypothetical protein
MEATMVKWTAVSAFCVAALLIAGTALAQENATLTLKSGDRVSGQLVDLGGVGYTVRVNGEERHIPQNDVAVIDFTGGNMTDADWAKFNGTTLIVLRNGQTLEGQLYDIGGTTPLRLTIKTATGDRDLSSSEVARVVMARPANAVATSGTQSAAATPAGGVTINVPGNQAWTSTGITVRRGEVLNFSTTGEVQLSTDANDKATADGALSGRFATNAPLPRTLAGALIGRIGNGQPFPIANQSSITAPANGTLYLGVNDDAFGDNQGAFQVTITRQGVKR